MTRLPKTLLTLKPHFEHDGASYISVELRLERPQASPAQPLFEYDKFWGNVPSHPYTVDDINAQDDAGLLSFKFQAADLANTPSLDKWFISRYVMGDLILKFNVYPRQVDITTPLGARIDLRRDHSGLMATGRWFLPRLLQDQERVYTLRWDLSEAPEGTRAIWSFGEGPGPLQKQGSWRTLFESVYMVGPVQSFPEQSAQISQIGKAITYWFGNLPEKMDRVKGYNSKLYPKMAEFFNDADHDYRVFFRHSIRGYGGSGFFDSYVLEFDDKISEEDDSALQSIFTHEMVHSFAVVAESREWTTRWYAEGIAEIYSYMLPYRFGLCDKGYLERICNILLRTYFTSPLIGIEIHESEKIFFTNWYAEYIPYKRGHAYLLQIDSRLRGMTGRLGPNGNGPMDEIVISLAARAKRGEKITNQHWLDSIYPYFGKEVADRELQAMLDGSYLDLSQAFVFSPAMSLHDVKQAVLQYGFDKTSVNKRVVSGLVTGSAAGKAGLRDGDHILTNSRAQIAADLENSAFSITVQREGKPKLIEYLAHKEEMVTVWQV
ncbi:peptidase m61 domain-containing protein [Penicillium malachiteum]|uniref:Peptidase m61 domain-containing protein n=1 Tax=Penicillium malachiteum TaxID=1324776 RepID=A0AAD6HBT1_9EURO|nr:peptidase m61 domain-containing protein [Penicillium malachiteum]